MNIIQNTNILLFFILSFIISTASCRADELIKPHNPTKAELLIIKNIKDSDHNIQEEIENKIDDEHPEPPSHVLFAHVNLERGPSNIVAILIEYTHGVGQAGFPLYIFKNVKNKWVEIGFQNMMDDEYFIVKPKIVNGYKVIQFPHEKRDNMFDGKFYECPTCPKSD